MISQPGEIATDKGEADSLVNRLRPTMADMPPHSCESAGVGNVLAIQDGIVLLFVGKDRSRRRTRPRWSGRCRRCAPSLMASCGDCSSRAAPPRNGGRVRVVVSPGLAYGDD